MVLKKQLELSNIKFNDLSKQFNSHLVENSKKYMEVMDETNDLLNFVQRNQKQSLLIIFMCQAILNPYQNATQELLVKDLQSFYYFCL